MKKILVILMVLTMLVALTACTNEETKEEVKSTTESKTDESKTDDSKGLSGSVKIAYKEAGNNANTEWLEAAKTAFEAANPDVEVELNMILSNEGDYNTKTALMLQTDDSVDVMMIDSFLVPSLVGSNGLSEIPVGSWAEWDGQFATNIREGMTMDGSVYAIPISTDTRGLFYHVDVFEAAGIATPWEPKTWDDILDAVSKLHAAGVEYPLWINGSKAQGEGTTMQTFEMLISGTQDWIYDGGKWTINAQGFEDSLKFIQDLADMGIYDDTELPTMLDATSWQKMVADFPETGTMGMTLNGHWHGNDWIAAFPEDHYDKIKVAPMPNQNGGGFTSMSGGWTLGISELSENQELAYEFIKVAADMDNLTNYSNFSGDMTPRKDVADNPLYKDSNVYRYEMSAYADFTHFRPGEELYPSVSIEIQTAVESVITGQLTASEAAVIYAEKIESLVGSDNIISK